MSPTSSLSPSLLQHKGSMISPQCQPCSVRRGSAHQTSSRAGFLNLGISYIWSLVALGCGLGLVWGLCNVGCLAAVLASTH